MKLSNVLLALCVVPTISAFTVQAPKGRMQTSVASGFSYTPGGPPNGGSTVSSQRAATPQVNIKSPNGGSTLTTPLASSGPQVTSNTGTNSNGAPRSIWDTATPVTVQGGSLRTWSFPSVERVQVLLKTEGRPLQANIDLWQGPDNTPQKMAIYIEDGDLRPFSAVIETPRGNNAVAVRNTGAIEFPLSACVEADVKDGSSGLIEVTKRLSQATVPHTIQGGAIKTYSYAHTVASVQLLLRSDGRPLNARIELMQGPNNNKQVIEVYTEDGNERPFFVVLETPGSGNVVRVINAAPVEFPMIACVEPYMVEPGHDESASANGGKSWDSSSDGFFLTGR